ncbi:MAG: hypothetical protein GWO07_01765 [Candidatus Dadabacteria bacterium]|nr:hypothetical protein [Candidatus Dadabacteria bacterium]NIS07497.1 hypothetical protein [Candidatus Dadabacteria bacterium]NIV42845.1 hypothetical protein [Candidatus Dadabacteria bacterium]NIX14657.1 hypothetical protein [Candidatus Dadabacteria bacterium]NIY21134.1 hypothetical protein [Candidatus Dadabacteria bacterium]
MISVEMKRTNITILILIFAISFAAGCAGPWKSPNESIAAQELKIRNLLITPTIYDHAGVILEGKVWDLEFIEDKEDPDTMHSVFKLADRDGNYVNVTSDYMTTLLKEGEIVKITGMHTVIFDKESRMVTYHVQASKITPPSTFHY